MIEVRDVVLGYGGVEVIRCASLTIQEGECVGVYGANGTGKSTLLKGIAGAIAPMRGEVRRPKDVRVTLVPQRQGFDAAWPMTALDAAGLALSAQSAGGWLFGKRTKVWNGLERMGVLELARRPFAKLSGGQQQRVLLAGALAAQPRVLLLDEPAEGLDAASTAGLMRLLKEEARAGLAVMMISHEVAELAAVADRLAWVTPADAPGRPNVVELLTREAFFEHAVGPGRHVVADGVSVGGMR